MTQTGKRLLIGAIICLICLTFLGFIAYQNSETMSALRVQSMLHSLHDVLSRGLEKDASNESALVKALAQHPVSATRNLLTVILGADSEIVTGNWHLQSASPPSAVTTVLQADSTTPINAMTINGVQLNWYRAGIGKSPFELILIYQEADLNWAESLQYFIVPLLIALAIGLWGFGWLALIYRSIYTSEVAARKSAELARLEAEKANKAKSEFLSMMSNELRTPLNGILGFAQILLFDKGKSLHRDHEVAAEHILNAGELLLGLINQILDLAAIEAGSTSLEMEEVRAVEVINESVGLLDKVAAGKNLQILIGECVDDNDLLVYADRLRLKQVLLNLLGNAIKYNTTGSTVTVSWQLTWNHRLRISVTDDGPGIDLQKQEHLFVPFNRLGMSGKGIEGTGIGLSIAKGIIEQMGGEIGFTSTPGHSTTFWFEIGLSPEQDESEEIPT